MSNTIADKSKSSFTTDLGTINYYSLEKICKKYKVKLEDLPFTIRIILENILRNLDDKVVTEDDLKTVLSWSPTNLPEQEIPYMPSRVLSQDFTGVPAVVDLASMRSAIDRMGGNPKMVNPIVPLDLVIDHSVQIDFFGTNTSFALNAEKEFERNHERYSLLKWAQNAFENTRVIPPGVGICHQVNLEFLSNVVSTKTVNGEIIAFPDTAVGMDSHTTMVDGLGVLAWGVGGIEAEVVLVGQPYYMIMQEVIGVKLTGELNTGVTATDLVLTITEILRKEGVVGKFVEFYGEGVDKLPLADKATISNMCPEYGATAALFPVNNETIKYLELTGRPESQVNLVKEYTKKQHLFYSAGDPDPKYTKSLSLDLSTVEPSLAGPRRPQDKVTLSGLKDRFQTSMKELYGKETTDPSTNFGIKSSPEGVKINIDGETAYIDHGSIAIASITSCTNTSNPSVMIGAGLIAKKAIELGLEKKPWVKSSLAPGSQVVDDYLEAAGLQTYLDDLGFNIVGHGCTTCIGNSGPLIESVGNAVDEEDLVVSAVLSGNRNFEGRVHQQVKASFLASPMLVVSYALAGTVNIDLESEPIGYNLEQKPIYLKDIWPSHEEIRDTMNKSLNADMFIKRYKSAFEGDTRWQNLPVPTGNLYNWDPTSTYIQEFPIFEDLSLEPSDIIDIHKARVFAVLGDSITTDHISPAGGISISSPAAEYLQDKEVSQKDFNSYGSRRGNHSVMVPGTFANIRLKNDLAPDKEGGFTTHLPTGDVVTLFEAAQRYKSENTPLIVLAGKEYGSGSSRDWAAKGPFLLGVRAVIAETYERIHRSNLIGMGVIPLQYLEGENKKSLDLEGNEIFDINGLADNLTPGKVITVTATKTDGSQTSFKVKVRIDANIEVDYYHHGGVLQYVLRKMLKESK